MSLVDEFLDGTLSPAEFTHETHVRLTYLLLRERPLPEVLILLRDGLKEIAARAGHPEKYHETITFAFAALINERVLTGAAESWADFARANEDLLSWRSSAVLTELYDAETLTSEVARHAFLLPRRACVAAPLMHPSTAERSAHAAQDSAPRLTAATDRNGVDFDRL